MVFYGAYHAGRFTFVAIKTILTASASGQRWNATNSQRARTKQQQNQKRSKIMKIDRTPETTMLLIYYAKEMSFNCTLYGQYGFDESCRFVLVGLMSLNPTDMPDASGPPKWQRI